MLFLACLLIVMLPLALEKFLIRQWRRRVPLRFHVHGTRGKSTVTRMLAARLREAGYAVLSKTTGDRPEFQFPDGSVRPVRRWGPARIQEHAGILKLASRLNAGAVVVEGMALQGETLAVSEEMLQATHAVITNVRPDHAESMGPDRMSVARTLSLMMPPGRPVFTSREDGFEEIFRQGELLDCPCIAVETEKESPEVPAESIGVPTFIWQPFRLAGAVADYLEPTRIDGKQTARSKPVLEGEAPKLIPVNVAGVQFIWLDLFSVNDVDSSRLWLDALWDSLPAPACCAALLSTRQDRPLRTIAFMEWLKRDPRFQILAPMGGHAFAAWLRSPSRSLFPAGPFQAPVTLLKKLARQRQTQGYNAGTMVVIGLGNSHGYGERWRAMIARVREAGSC